MRVHRDLLHHVRQHARVDTGSLHLIAHVHHGSHRVKLLLLHHVRRIVPASTLIAIVTGTFLAIVILIPIIILLLRIHHPIIAMIKVAHRHEHRLRSASLSTSPELASLRCKNRLAVILLHHKRRILRLSILRLAALFLLLFELLLAVLLHAERHLRKRQLARVFRSYCWRLLLLIF